jgi:hypothetical protein
MDFKEFDFRHAEEILTQRHEWAELRGVIQGITDGDILGAHQLIAERTGRAPAGGQSAINDVFRLRLGRLGWEGEPRLFGDSEELAGWKMDFLKGRVGVEVSFNHAEAIPWTFTRLNIAGESSQVREDHRIDVGIAMFATDALKGWARMDGAVGTYRRACTWLEIMKPIMPIPVLVIGLDSAGWAPTDRFRGTKNRRNASLRPPTVGGAP